VSASAAITTGSGMVTITLTDLQANPKDIGQVLSGFSFTLSNGATTGTLTSSSAEQIIINSGGSFTLGSTGSTGWGLNNNVGGGLQLDALGYIGPAGLIVGPPGGANTYSNANASIAGNGPHNPFLNQTATFTLAVAGVTSSTTVTGATFSFGTTPGAGNVAVAESDTFSMLLSGLLALGLLAGIKRQGEGQPVKHV
jgi:hypothetical protein